MLTIIRFAAELTLKTIGGVHFHMDEAFFHAYEMVKITLELHIAD